MRNYKTRLANLRARLPPIPSPPPVILSPTELASHIENLLGLAARYPGHKVGRYTLKHRAGLAISCFEDARKRRDGVPHWSAAEDLSPLTAEERLSLLTENMDPRSVGMLCTVIGAPKPEVIWIRAHYEQSTPDGGMETAENSDLVWVKDCEPYSERGLYFSGGHLEGKDGQTLTWVSATYAFKDPAIKLQYKALAADGYYNSSSKATRADAGEYPPTPLANLPEVSQADSAGSAGEAATEDPEATDTLGDDAGVTEPSPSPEPSPIPAWRRPQPVGGGLRPTGRATEAWPMGR